MSRLFLLIIVTIFCVQASPIFAQTFSIEQKKALEKIIKNYLIDNPLIIKEALEALHTQEKKGQQSRIEKLINNRKKELLDDPMAPFAGNQKGDVTIVEFFDYNCGYCKQVWPTLRKLVEKDKNVRIIFKELPILGPTSLLAAKAALAANRQGKYIEFHTELMQTRSINERIIKVICDKLNIDQNLLEKDMKLPSIVMALQKNAMLAQDLEVNGTPAFLIGRQIIPGAIGLDQLIELVAAERSAKQ